MTVRIFNRQSFGDSRRIEVSVSGNQGEGLAQRETAPVDLERRRQLDGIVIPKKKTLRQPHGLIHESRSNPYDVKARPEIGTEKSLRCGGMGCR